MSEALFEQTYFNPSNSGSLASQQKFVRQLERKDRKKAKEWLLGEDAYTLHKGVRKTFPRRRVIVSGIDDQFQADLVDMQNFKLNNHNNSYILTEIDVFSKFAWAFPLKNKSGSKVAHALNQVFRQRKCRALQTDKGKEFYNREVKNLMLTLNIKHFSTENDDIKASVIERFNRTLQNKLYRWFTKHNTSNWDSILQSIVEGYNKTTHSATKFPPIKVNHENEEDVWHNLYQPTKSSPRKGKIFQLNDSVRVSKYKHVFSKGYESNWSTEKFLIHEILPTQPVTYRLRDHSGEVIAGSYYAQELQRVKPIKPADIFAIETVIKKRKRKGKTEYFVQWKGYPSSFNSWIDESQMVL